MNTKKDLRNKLNQVNVKYNELKTHFDKNAVPVVYIERLNKIRRELETKLKEECLDDLNRLNNGFNITIH